MPLPSSQREVNKYQMLPSLTLFIIYSLEIGFCHCLEDVNKTYEPVTVVAGHEARSRDNTGLA